MSNASIGRTPLRPLVSPCQNVSMPVPTGVTGPMPVITTLRRSLTEGIAPRFLVLGGGA